MFLKVKCGDLALLKSAINLYVYFLSYVSVKYLRAVCKVFIWLKTFHFSYTAKLSSLLHFKVLKTNLTTQKISLT